jgi:hypothetical protein
LYIRISPAGSGFESGSFRLGALDFLAITLVFLAAPAAASSNDFLVPFWGSDLTPIADIGWRVSVQLDQFTELNNDTLRFPLGRKTDDCDYYCETIGFNTLQATRTIAWRPNLRLSMGGFLGVANDGLTEFLQNDYSHRLNGIAGVPRQGEREGVLFGVSLEADRDLVPGWVFGGMGMLANNVYHEAFLHSGLILQRQPLFGTRFGIKYSAVSRLEILRPSPEYVVSGKRYFPILSPAVGTAQAEAGMYTHLFGIPLEFSWRGECSTGVFINQDRDRPEGMWLEGLKTVIWKFSFERYNDALNGTDYGPTYGVKMSFSP